MFIYFLVLSLLLYLFVKINRRLLDHRSAWISGAAALLPAAFFPFVILHLGLTAGLLCCLAAAALLGLGVLYRFRSRSLPTPTAVPVVPVVPVVSVVLAIPAPPAVAALSPPVAVPAPAIPLGPPPVEEPVSQALAAAARGDFVRAVSILTTVLRDRPEPALQWVIVSELSSIYQHLGQYSLAGELIGAFLTAHPASEHPLIPVLRQKQAFCHCIDRLLRQRGSPNLAYASVPDNLRCLALQEALAARVA